MFTIPRQEKPQRFTFLRVPRDVISRYKRSIRKPNQTVAWFKSFQTNDVFQQQLDLHVAYIYNVHGADEIENGNPLTCITF